MSNAPRIKREQLLTLIPHAGRMCLLDEVLAHSPIVVQCVTHTHRDQQNPLRQGNQLAALHLAEYGAQATAVHGALLAGGAQPGVLAALRDIKLYVERIDTIETALTITATRRIAQTDGSLYDFQVHAGEQLLGEGRIAIARGFAGS